MNSSILKNLKKNINMSIDNINKEINIRSRKLSFRDIIYCSSLMVTNNQSYDIINASLKINNIVDVSTCALIKYKNGIHNTYFNEINKNMISFIYEGQKNRIIAVDGTYINLLKSLINDGFKLSRNGNYCISLISTLFDVEREIPINYKLFINNSERDALIKQFKYLNKGDILIMDRGYYSKKLLYLLNNRSINIIFRLKNNLKQISSIKNKNDVITFIEYEGTKIKFRIIKYKINNKIYYLGTTIYDKNIKYFKDLYWKRWKIEINFRHSKYNLSMNNIKSKTKNSIIQDIYTHNFVFILSSYLQYCLQKNMNYSFKISTSSHLNITVNNILYYLLYKKATKNIINKLLTILNISKQVSIPIRSGRSYKRIKKRPTNKWCQYGNKYKMVK